MELLRGTALLRRFGAAVIDHFIILLVTIMSFFFVIDPENPELLAMMNRFSILLVCSLGLYCCKDIVNGRSIGKRFFGLAVRDENGDVPSVSKLITRNLFLVIWPVEIFLIVKSKKRKRIGDRIAKTDVYLINKSKSIIGMIVSIVSLFAVIICIMFVGIVQIIKQDSSYKTAVDYIKSSPEIVGIVGDNISIGFFPNGSIQYGNGYGNSDLTIKVKGDKRKLTVHIILRKEPNTSWTVESMEY